jgi:cofilin
LKLAKQLRYVIYKVSDDKASIQVEATAPKTASYDDFLKALPEKDCRFAVFDFEWQTPEGQRNKIAFIQW